MTHKIFIFDLLHVHVHIDQAIERNLLRSMESFSFCLSDIYNNNFMNKCHTI